MLSVTYGENISALAVSFGIKLAIKDSTMRFNEEKRNGTKIELRSISELMRSAHADITREARRSMAKLERARVFVSETTEAIELPEINEAGTIIEDGFHRMRALAELGYETIPVRIMISY